MLPADGGGSEEVLSPLAKAGVDVDAVAATLQDEGAKSFVKSWNELMERDPGQDRGAEEGELTPNRDKGPPMNILVIDVGGTHVKILASGEDDRREIDSGPTLTARQMVSSVKKLADGWEYDVVSIGYPGPVVHDRPMAEPHNLGKGWMGSTSLRHSNCRRKSSTMPRCRRSAATGAAKCCFWGSGRGSVRR